MVDIDLCDLAYLFMAYSLTLVVENGIKLIAFKITGLSFLIWCY